MPCKGCFLLTTLALVITVYHRDVPAVAGNTDAL